MLFDYSKEYQIAERYPEAIRSLLKAKELLLELEDEAGLALCNERLGVLYYRIGDYDQAVHNYLSALNYSEKNASDRLSASIAGNLANVYTRIEHHEEALRYLKKSKSLFSQDPEVNRANIIGTNNNIGLAYAGIPELDSAMHYYELALEATLERKDKMFRAAILNNMGDVYLEQGDFEEAQGHYDQALAIFLKLQNSEGLATAYHNIARVKRKQGKLREAIRLDHAGLKHSESANVLYLLTGIQEHLSETYRELGVSDSAYLHLLTYMAYNDSLQGTEILSRIAQLEMGYAVEKEQQKLKIVEQENELRDKRSKLNQAYSYMMIGGIAVLLIISLFAIRFLRIRLQRNKLKQEMLDQRQQQLRSELTFKQREVERFATHIQEKNMFLDHVKDQMKSILPDKINENAVNELFRAVDHNLHIDNDRKELELKIDQAHQEFIGRLRKRFPDLSKTEVRLSSLLLLDLSSKEIAGVMSIAPASVKTSRNRLRKKLELPAHTDLAKFLHEV